jgi:proteasome accessory factor B
MKKIYDLLQAGTYPNCFTIAEGLEVSHKTARRDVEFMRNRLRWPIEYDQKRHGYFFTRPVDRFPGVPVTESEMFALVVAHKAIEHYRGTPFQRPLRMAFQKLTRQLDGRERYALENLAEVVSFRPFAPEDTDFRVFESVTRALVEGRALRFRYRKPGSKVLERRHVHPYHLMCVDHAWYLMGHAVTRRAIRTFALARLSRPEVTDERFARPKDFDPEKHLNGSFGVMWGGGDHEVAIEFDAWAADLLRRRRWHSSQVVRALAGGGVQLRMRLSGLREVERWVLSWGEHATVVRPAELVERVKRAAGELVKRYL